MSLAPDMQPTVQDAPPYALFAQLEGLCVVVVGAGRVAARKVASLLECRAQVRVIAPEAVDEIAEAASLGRIELVSRPYASGDLSGAVLAIAATSDRAVNEAVFAEAQQRSMLVNVVDAPELCNFTAPSVLRRGKLQVAVSTSGAAPSVAREVRLGLEQDFPAWWEPYLNTLADVRALVKQRVAGPSPERMALLEAVGCRELREQFGKGERPTAEEVYERYAAPLAQGGTR